MNGPYKVQIHDLGIMDTRLATAELISDYYDEGNMPVIIWVEIILTDPQLLYWQKIREL